MRLNLAPVTTLFAPLAMKVALAIILGLAGFAGWQTVRLSWANETIANAERDKANAVAEAVREARQADARARQTAEREKALSGAEIERGREAAEGSDDPWREATEAMRP